VGITLVGLSSVLSGEGSQTHVVSVPQMLLGMGLIVASQVRRAPARAPAARRARPPGSATAPAAPSGARRRHACQVRRQHVPARRARHAEQELLR
jgi:hypothetical protein